MNRIDAQSRINEAPGSGDASDYEQIANGTARPFKDPNPLRVLKVTGTVTGGYSFTEQTDPDGDGSYTDYIQGEVNISGNYYLVAPSGITLATNDLVVARRNPFLWERFETICYLGTKATTNVLSFNTGTRDLTSTVNGVASVANIPAGGGGSVSAVHTSLASNAGISTSIGSPTTLLSLSVTNRAMVSFEVGFLGNAGVVSTWVVEVQNGGSRIARATCEGKFNASVGGTIYVLAATTITLLAYEQSASGGTSALGDTTFPVASYTWISALKF